MKLFKFIEWFTPFFCFLAVFHVYGALWLSLVKLVWLLAVQVLLPYKPFFVLSTIHAVFLTLVAIFRVAVAPYDEIRAVALKYALFILLVFN